MFLTKASWPPWYTKVNEYDFILSPILIILVPCMSHKFRANFTKKPKRLCLSEVEMGKNYVLIVSSNAGLWAYSLEDTVLFTSINPYKIKIRE